MIPTNSFLLDKNLQDNLKSIAFILIGAAFFLIPLILIWNGYALPTLELIAYYSALLGSIPYSDAAGYYQGAIQFLNTGLLPSWNLRRPVHTLLFSSELFLMHKNYWLTMIHHVFMCGLSCSIASYIVKKTLGQISGITFLIVSFTLAQSLLPTTLTETTGITLGMFAFIFLWNGYIKQQTLTFSFGIFILTLALHSRAGAFLVLPCMVFLAMLDFSQLVKERLKILAFSMISIVCATLIIILLQKFHGNSTNQIHSNFACVIFGIVSGGKGWLYANQAYPILSSMSEPEQASFLYKETLKVFLQHPFLIFLGFFKSLGGFIQYHLNLLIPKHLLTGKWWLSISVKIVGLSFFLFCVHTLKRAYTSQNLRRIINFNIAGIVGIISSALIIWKDGGIRVFAATYSFWALTMSLVLLSYKYRKNIDAFSLNCINQEGKIYTKLAPITFLSYYLGLILILPFFIQPQKINNQLLLTPLEKNIIVVQNTNKDPYMTVYPNNTLLSHKLRKITHNKYNLLISKSWIEHPQDFINIADKYYPSASFIIFASINLLDHSLFYTLADPAILQVSSPLLKLKGEIENQFFIVQSYEPLN